MKVRELITDLILEGIRPTKDYQVRMIMTAPDGTQLECEVKEWIVSDRQEAIILIGSNFDRDEK